MQRIGPSRLILAALVLAACTESVPPAPAPGPVAVAKATSLPVAPKPDCASREACVQAMLTAADPLDQAALAKAESSLRKLNTATKGDAGKARQLQKQGEDARGKGNRKGGLDLLKQAAAADPSNTEILDSVAIANIQSNDLATAAGTLYVALAVDPAYGELWSSLSLLLTAQGKKEDAVRALLLAYNFEKDRKRLLAQWEQDLGSMNNNSRYVFTTAIGKIKSAGGGR